MSFPPFFQAERLFIVFGKCVKYRFVVLYVVLTIVSKSVSLFVTKLLTPTFELIFEFVVFIHFLLYLHSRIVAVSHV